MIEKKKGTIPTEKSITANGLSCVERNPKYIFHNFGNLLRPLELVPASREHVVPTESQVRTILGDCISKGVLLRSKRHSNFVFTSLLPHTWTFKFPVMSKTENWRIRSRKASDAHCTTPSLGLPEASRVSPCANPWRSRHRLHIQRAWRQRYLRSTPTCHTPPN